MWKFKIYSAILMLVQVRTLPRPRKNDDSRNGTLKRSRRHSRPTEWFQEKTESVKETLTRAKETIQRQISTDTFRAKSPDRVAIRQVQSQVELRETVRTLFIHAHFFNKNVYQMRNEKILITLRMKTTCQVVRILRGHWSLIFFHFVFHCLHSSNEP